MGSNPNVHSHSWFWIGKVTTDSSDTVITKSTVVFRKKSAKCGWDWCLPQCYHPGYVKQRKQYTVISFLLLPEYLTSAFNPWLKTSMWTHTDPDTGGLPHKPGLKKCSREQKGTKPVYPLIHSSLSTRYMCMCVCMRWIALSDLKWVKQKDCHQHSTRLLFLLQHNSVSAS